MADQANSFSDLTPEQQAQLQRQAVQSGISPFELFTMLAAGPAAGIAYGGLRAAGLGRLSSAVGGAAMGAGGLELGQRYGERIRDAEGQPGGLYGEDPKARIARRLMER
mgnify:CR=1 FL=1